MSKGARIRKRHDEERLQEQPVRRKGISREQPRMFSRRVRGVKVTADPTPRPEATQKILNVRAVWRRPKDDQGRKYDSKVTRLIAKWGVRPGE